MLLPKTLQAWAILVAATLIGAIHAWIASGGPNPLVAGLPVLSVILTVLAYFQTPPTVTPASIAKALGTTLTLCLACVLTVPAAAFLGGCTPAQSAVWASVETVVLHDLENGVTSLETIDVDVARALDGQVGVDIATVVNDALTILIDLGVIPAKDLPTARGLLAQSHERLAARAAHDIGQAVAQ